MRKYLAVGFLVLCMLCVGSCTAQDGVSGDSDTAAADVSIQPQDTDDGLDTEWESVPQKGLTEYKVPIELDAEKYEYLAPAACYGENILYAAYGGTIYPGDVVGYVTFGVGTHKQNAADTFSRYYTYRVVSENGSIVEVEEADTITKAAVLEHGTPYMGELNGDYNCKVYGDSGLIVRGISIYEDTVTVSSYVDGTDNGGAYEGTFTYDPVTGDIMASLTLKYHDGHGNIIVSPGNWFSGKLYEYGGFVHFICESSDSDTMSPNDDLPLTFLPSAEPCDTVSRAEWVALGFDEYNYVSDRIFYLIRAFLSGDVDAFAGHCGTAPKVYDSLRGMKLGEWRLYREDIPAADDSDRTRGYPVLEFEVLESGSDFFTSGTHRLVFDEGLFISFTPRESFAWYTNMPPNTDSAAMRYISQVGFEDFYPILGESRSQFGLCDFIVARLDTLMGNYDPRTAEEIRAYAEKYLGVDGDTLNIEQTLESVDGGYTRIGRGGGTYFRTYLSEELRDGIAVVTVQFWADYSMTVPSRKVEFHMELLDGEYRPIKTVVLEDSGLNTAYVST